MILRQDIEKQIQELDEGIKSNLNSTVLSLLQEFYNH